MRRLNGDFAHAKSPARGHGARVRTQVRITGEARLCPPYRFILRSEKSQRKTPGDSRGAVLRKKRLTLAALLAGLLLPALLSALPGLLLLLARLLRAAALLARLALAALLLLARILLVRIVHNRSYLHLPRDRKRLRHRSVLFKSLRRGLMSR